MTNYDTSGYPAFALLLYQRAKFTQKAESETVSGGSQGAEPDIMEVKENSTMTAIQPLIEYYLKQVCFLDASVHISNLV